MLATPAHLSRSRERSIHVEEGDDAGVLGDRHGAERIWKDGEEGGVPCVLLSSFVLLEHLSFWNKKVYMYTEAVSFRAYWSQTKI